MATHVDLESYACLLSIVLSERDHHTLKHCQRVIDLAEALGHRCDLTADDCSKLSISSLLHDIGKVGIPDRVLLKQGSLDQEEWAVMCTHSERGEHIVASIMHDDIGDIAKAVRHHHEHFDGTGYPDGLSGEDIPYLSRIITIIDSYDAMAETRPYHRARSHHQIMDILRAEAGRTYDPDILTLFTEMIDLSDLRAPVQ